MNKYALILASALVGAPAMAGDQLEPLTSDIQTPVGKDNTDLKEVLDPAVALGVMVQPSFGIEFAVLLEKREGRNAIVTLQYDPGTEDTLLRYQAIEELKKQGEEGAKQIAELQKDLPPFPKDAKPDRCEVALEPAVADKLALAWKAALDQAKPDPDSMGQDGTDYLFFVQQGGTYRFGKTWSPKPVSQAGRLVEIAGMMHDYCRSRPETMARAADQLIESGKPKS